MSRHLLRCEVWVIRRFTTTAAAAAAAVDKSGN
jgi:hypothetical protein